MRLEFDSYSAFHHTNLVIWVPFSIRFRLSSRPFRLLDTIFSTFWSFISPIWSFHYLLHLIFYAFMKTILSLRYHFEPILGFITPILS